MDKEQFQKAMMMYNTGAISLPEFTEFCMTYIKELEQRVEVLTYNYEAQGIIIKDKTAIMEAITAPNKCNGCKYKYRWYCLFYDNCIRSDFSNKTYPCTDYYHRKATR